ncbi:MAG: TonB-dependent receptor [Pseudomonadota bacterium]
MKLTYRRPLARGLFLAASSIALAISPTIAAAQANSPQQIELPAQPLSQALAELARRYGIDFVAPQQLTRGKTAPRISGRMTAAQALDRLLAGSGLTYRRSRDGRFIVAKAQTNRTSNRQVEPSRSDQASQANDELESRDGPIIVTGTKQNQTIQDTQTSVTVITGEQAEERVIFDIEDLALRLPNISTAGEDANSISIRGISVEGVSNVGSGVTANIYVDGTPSSGTASAGAFNLWDVGQVEVLRGPQSTTQGRNALAGAIVIQSADPEYEFGGKARVIIGNENNRQYSAAVTGPIIADQVAFRMSADYRELDFGVTNQIFDTRTRFQEALTLRGKLLVEPEFLPDLRLELIGEYSEVESGDLNRVTAPVPFGDPTFDDFDPFGNETFSGFENFFDINTTRFIVDADYQLDENWSLKLLGTHEASDSDNDTGFLGTGLTEDRTYTAELRASFNYEGINGWIGGYFFDNSRDLTSGGVIPPNLIPFPLDPPDTILNLNSTSGIGTRNYALFGNLTFAVTERLTIDLGARYDWEDFESSGLSGSLNPDPEDCTIPAFVTFLGLGGQPCTALAPLIITGEPPAMTSFGAFLPRGSIIYDFDDDRSISFTIARGYRAGGVVQRIVITDFSLQTFDPEFLTNYEFAFRSEWPDLGLTFNANIFYSDWTDQQVSIPGPTGGQFDFFTVNAGGSELYGAEFSAQLELTDRLELFGNAGLLWTEFTDFAFAVDENGDPINQADPQFANLAGDSFNSAPRFNASFGISYDEPDGFFGNLNASYSDGQESSVPNLAANVTDSFFLVNARAGYRFGKFELALFANNLFDERTILRQLFTSVSPATGAIQEDGAQFVVNDPRLWGVEARVRF